MITFSSSSFSYLCGNRAIILWSRFRSPSLVLHSHNISLSRINRAVNSGAEMADLLNKSQQLGTEKYPRKSEKWIQYGTAGFRTKAEELTHVLYRMGILAAFRSMQKNAIIGVMITASHNDEPDNGVKLVDPHGEMLEASWEVIATKLANAKNEDLESTMSQILEENGITIGTNAMVYVGRDTRPSSPFLAQAAIDGIKSVQGCVTDFGVVSTPQLHFFVTCQNTNKAYGEPNEEGYFSKISSAFKALRGSNYDNGSYQHSLSLDGANGVGALKMKAFQEYLGNCIEVTIYNSGDGKLNYQCGADHIKVLQKPPQNMPLEVGTRAASLDGDADRLVYFYLDTQGNFKLLDGDKIATLVAGYIKKLIKESGVNLNVGLVQTAYANGSSTEYINNTLGVEVACVPTGVKYLHHRALEFDVGVYFEANGHGTVVFSSAAMETIKNAAADESLPAERIAAAKQLFLLMDVINQTVGDAISDLLLVETVLHAFGWGVAEWDAAYTDLPNRQMKVSVADRNVIQTADAERRCTDPPGLQSEIDSIVAKFNKGRSFVRPSGTEDVVRVYAEADSQANADKLAHEVALKVYELANGVGNVPSLPK
ncbi:phosphoacetylglucosamine mutase-like [Daphnia pulicaria]|uniref:phosphoacetylglucosamine mutase-like n=1 Tax=Daphnia pulicaria TaxID=35523 RepID=UPI001EEC964B|nr:phosphoacetylglucosamine mutase-like [Daphnia pulicaria]